MPGRAMPDPLHEEQVRAFVRDNVRAGLLAPEEVLAEAEQAVTEELPWLPPGTAEQWVAAETAAWRAEARDWPAVTEHDRLQAAFAELERGGVAVLQGCEDHWAAKALLERRDDVRGVAWFVPPDVWHAIDEGMLEVNVWHASGANVAPGDTLLDDVLGVFTRHDLPAHFDEGRIEVSAHWQRRP
jgi:hypothetical protein